MGQGQSSSNDAPAGEPAVKQDYYELLGVERTATDDEIKKSYRRKALELHPDRNHGREEEATRLFADIGAAYEVLADPQERAWYDSHRDILLRGEQPGADGEAYSYNMKLTSSDEVLKLMMRFNKNVAYSDSPSGFFGGLNDFFKQLAKEEDVACQWQDMEFLDYPEFGSKDDDYNDIVRPFYGAWSGFATKKSYSWKDMYRLSDAPDRRIRRLMEKENQKLRDDAIAEFNDAVRSLVAFVRKRDVRVQNNQKSDAERQKILRESAAAQAARMRAKRQAELEKNASGGISAWAHTPAKDEHEGRFSSESEAEDHEFDCVVCDKTFKSEKQFQAHEKSKKHIKLLKELKREMRKEGKDLDFQEQEPPASTGNEPDEVESRSSSADTHDTKPADVDSKTSDEDEVSNEKDQNSHSVIQLSSPGAGSDEDDDDYVPRDKLADRLAGRDSPGDLATATSELDLDETPAASGADTPSKRKLGKAKQKRAKKAAQQTSAEAKSTGAVNCAVCNEEFRSKTKLFDHIKKEGHIALKVDLPSSTKGGKAKKKK